jgi:anti-anti-sigma factor
VTTELPDVFRCDVRSDREGAVVTPVGELDHATLGILEREVSELRAADFHRIVLDLSRLGFADSSALRFVLDLAVAAQKEGWELLLHRGTPAVHRVFELAGVVERLPFSADGTHGASPNGAI